jgi:molecular chaperone GrpE
MPSEPINSEQDQIPEQQELDNKTTQDPGQEQELIDDDSQVDSEDMAVELARSQATIKDYWEQIMRLNAEIENNRKRAQRDIENAHKYAVKSFVETLLPVADSMELGLNASNAENVNLESIKEGMSMTLDMFLKTLTKNGITAVGTVGEKFNPEHHQAMSMQEHDEADPNTVLVVMQKGYLLNDRLIRPAMVVVSKEKT